MGFLDLFRSTKPLQEELDGVKQATHQGFSNVKRDIGALSGWVAYLQKTDEEKNHRLDRIEAQLEHIMNELKDIEFVEHTQAPQKQLSAPKQEQENTKSVLAQFDMFKKLNSLTVQQRNLFNILCRIALESGNEYKSMVDIAQDVYANKSYGQVRTTLSAYTTRLEELGLVERTRKGRFVYIRLTKAAVEGLKGGEIQLVDHLPV